MPLVFAPPATEQPTATTEIGLKIKPVGITGSGLHNLLIL